MHALVKTHQHPLVSIEENAPAMGTNLKAPEALKAGHINVGAELVEMSADANTDDSKVKRLQTMAQTITCKEFAEGIKKAQELADTIDAANGFKKPDSKGLKPSEYYGPKRTLLNARMSEAKRIFGVAKQSSDVLKEKNYWPALKAARDWLDANQRTWDGNVAESKEVRAVKREQKLVNDTQKAVVETYPILMGETIEQWHNRINPMIEKALESERVKKHDERVETVIASIRKQFGEQPDVLREACERLVAEFWEADQPQDTPAGEEEKGSAE